MKNNILGFRIQDSGCRTFLSLFLILYSLLFTGCNPEAPWVVDDVTIEMSAQNVSAGFIEYNFHPNKDAYYLISCMPANELVDPFNHSKQFMILALDSANTAYIQWRNGLLREGEFNIAPFASHCLQYGPITHFFTNLTPDTDYWVFAFVVNPETLKPVGKLFIETVKTTAESIMDVHFDYRVRGIWDYIYPLDPDNKINSKLPYLASTVDSLNLAEIWGGITPEDYFNNLFTTISESHDESSIHYGVTVVKNDGSGTSIPFEVNHTYYTAIVSYDGFMGNNVIYRFHWTGDDYEAYFTDENNIAIYREDE